MKGAVKLIEMKPIPVEGIVDAFTMQLIFECVSCGGRHIIELKEGNIPVELEEFMQTLLKRKPNRDITCPICIGKSAKLN